MYYYLLVYLLPCQIYCCWIFGLFALWAFINNVAGEYSWACLDIYNGVFLFFVKKFQATLAGWLMWLEFGLVHQKVVGAIPARTYMYLGSGSIPSQAMYGRPVFLTLIFFSLSLPLFLCLKWMKIYPWVRIKNNNKINFRPTEKVKENTHISTLPRLTHC